MMNAEDRKRGAESGMINAEDKKEERRQERFSSKTMAVSAKYLRRIRELPHMPEALQPFLEVIEHIYSKRQK